MGNIRFSNAYSPGHHTQWQKCAQWMGEGGTQGSSAAENSVQNSGHDAGVEFSRAVW